MTIQPSSELEKKINWMKRVFVDFPFMSCKTVSLDLHYDLGYLIVRGSYAGDFDDKYKQAAARIWGNLPSDFNCVPHYFSYDPERELYVDVTVGQFHRSNPDVVLMPKDDSRVAWMLEESNGAATHYVDQMFTMKKVRGLILPFVVNTN
ncbi:MAG: hypothetical protein KAT77_03435 [Nanoarchaeota archaeon]|nr:hypothetical protein [Nanoarchaeota archaeon]